MKLSITTCAVFLSITAMATTDPAKTDNPRGRTLQAPNFELNGGSRGSGLAPASWSGAFRYEDTLYGTSSYIYSNNRTISSSPVAFIFDSTFASFVGNGRATFLFDVSSFSGAPSPQWSGFIFDTADQPALGDSRASAIAAPTLSGSGDTYTLEGLAAVATGGERGVATQTFNLLDGESIESVNGTNNANNIFNGTNPLIGNFTIEADNTYKPFSVDVSAAVIDDLLTVNPAVPTLQEWSLIVFTILLAGAGLLMKRRTN